MVYSRCSIMGNKPRIRFKGFTEDWEQRKLLTVLNKIVDYRGRTPKKLGLDWSPTGHLALSALNVKMGYVDKTIDAHYGDDHLYSVWMKDNDLYEGQVLFTTEAPMGNVAQVPDNNKYILSQRTIAFVPDRSVISDNFLAVVLSASKCQKSLINRASGGTAKGVSQKTLSEISLDIPQSLSEQDKVSELIKKLSKIITLHQCKLEKLKLTKKALLQKLFPKNGKHIPEIRFKGFTDAWEQRKFSDITYLSGVKNKENKPYESYSISNEFGFIPQDEQFENGGTMKTANKSMYYIVSQNSFAYNPARINVGSIGYYDKPDNVIVSSLYEVFKTTEIVNDKFLWHWFKSSQFNHLIEKYQEGGVRLYFYYDKLCKGTIELPTINEQNKISNLLDSLDMYITLHQRKLERLQEVKKGLLQKMFV